MFKLAEELLVELYAQLWVHSTLQQQLISTQLIESVNLTTILVYSGYKVLLCLVWLAVEVTEEAARGADIGRIDIAIYLPSDNTRIGHHLLA
jgi:hypothetical protein